MTKRNAVTRHLWLLIALAAVLAFMAVVRIRLLNVPLERDEGEYAYAGQLMLQGMPPYGLAYNMKFPGIYAAYALMLAVFGQSIAGVHWGLILANAAAIVLVFALARRLFGSVAGVAAAATYALLSMSQSVLGVAAHATHFVVVPALGGILLLMKARDADRPWMYFLGGVALGLAPLVKQHGAAFTLFGLWYVVSPAWQADASRRTPGAARRAAGARGRPTASRAAPAPRSPIFMHAALYSLGALLPFGFTCAALLRAGVFDRFWFWTVSYARQYAAEAPLAQAWPAFVAAFSGVVGPSLLLWVLAACGLIVIWWSQALRRHAPFLSAFAAFSALGVVPGFYFRSHYFILLLPAVAVLASAVVAVVAARLATARLSTPLRYTLPALLFAIPAFQAVWQERAVWFELSPNQVSRATYGRNPFPEALAMGRYISEHSSPADRIAVLGSEPEIYFYSGRRSATGYIYTYGLMEPQPFARRMQEEMIREIEAAKPKYLVFINVAESWIRRESSEMRIFEWSESYLKQHYGIVGVVDIIGADETVYRWDAEAATYTPRSFDGASVFRRLDGPTLDSERVQ